MKRSDLMLEPSSPLKGNEPDAPEGRVGLLVLDEDVARIVAFTAAQIGGGSSNFKSKTTAVARSSHNWNYFNSGLDYLDFNARVRPADTMIVGVIIDDTVKLSRDQPTLGVTDSEIRHIVHDTNELLGQNVLIYTSPTEPRSAYLCSAGGRFRMHCPFTKRITLFTDALQLESLDNKPVTKKGDAGAVVTTLSGAPLGVIICGFDRVSYAAPLRKIFEDQKTYSLLTIEIVEDHNSRSDAPHAATVELERGSTRLAEVDQKRFVDAVEADDDAALDELLPSIRAEYLA